MRSLPDTSMHDQQWESNPRPFDLESNAHPLHHMLLCRPPSSDGTLVVLICDWQKLLRKSKKSDVFSMKDTMQE